MARAKKPLIGVVMSIAESDPEVSGRREAILQGLGRSNLQIVFKFGRNTPQDKLRSYEDIAKELVDLNPKAIFSSCWPTMTALARKTKKIPIVYAGLFNKDGKESGYKFGNNVTGFVSHEFDVCGQWPSLLRELAPELTQAAVIHESISSGGTTQFDAIKTAAGNFVKGIDLTKFDTASKLRRAIEEFKLEVPAGGLIVTTGALTASLGGTIIELAAELQLPAIYPNRLYSVHGGLLSYGADLLDLYRRAGGYLGKTLDGKKPLTLKTRVNKRFELVINLDTAKSLKLVVSGKLRDQARLLVGTE